MELEVGEVVNATAEYIGEDKDNYKNVTMTVAITRSNCDHKESDVICDKTVVETDEEPTCEESGMGHTICTKAFRNRFFISGVGSWRPTLYPGTLSL